MWQGGRVRVAVVVGPEAGHVIPAIELCRRLRDAGEDPVLITGPRWRETAAAESIPFVELRGLAPRPGDDDADAGAKIHDRAAHVATEMLPDLQALAPDLVVADTITVGGALAAERLALPWVELVPHPLYLPSRGLPPLGSGLAPGRGLRGRVRDRVLRALTARAIRSGDRARASARLTMGLPATGGAPAARMVAVLPGLEVPRPDWPADTYVVGPLLWDPTAEYVDPPPGEEPLVLIAPSTATAEGSPMAQVALAALAPENLGGRRVRALITTFGEVPADLPDWARAGRSRQDRALAEAAVVVCGAGHGMMAKALAAGVPVVAVPGGGDQWEVAQRARRAGCAVVVRPLTAAALAAGVAEVLGDHRRYRAAARRVGAVPARVDAVQVCRRAADRATVAGCD